MPFTSFILFFTLHVHLSLAKPINVTVDDQFGVWPAFGLHQNITYGTGWFNSRLNECNSCQNSTTPTAFQHAVNGTWKRASYRGDSGKAKGKPKFATFTFNGTGVYVNIIRAPNTDTGVPGNIELLFNLDGVPTRVLDDAQSTVFPQTIFSNSSMTQREHTLTIQNGDPSGKYIQCMIFLDSIVYTTDDSLLFNIPMVSSEGPPPTALAGSKPTVGVATIVAGIGGAVGGILVTFLFFLLFRRIKGKQSHLISSVAPLSPSGTLGRNPNSSRLSPFMLRNRPDILSLTSVPPTYRTHETL